MPQNGSNATFVPAEGSILCENCGYTLDGLPEGGNCPECGCPVAKSLEDGRGLPAWEDDSPGRPRLRFLATTAAVIFGPARFYRSLQTRRDNSTALMFAQGHWLISAVLLGLALSIHVKTMTGFGMHPLLLFVVSTVSIYLLVWGTTQVAAWLTAWEAAYRGYRLPKSVVLRGMYYHAAHYLPVSLVALATIATYGILFARNSTWAGSMAPRYVLLLCIEVLAGAGYLFMTYWAGMRGMMFANR